MVWLFRFLQSQLLITLPIPTSDFSNQTVIVTGSNTGLGLEAARHLVRLGAAKVILAVRTTSKGETAKADIIQSCNVPASRVEVWQLDLADSKSIIGFAKRAETLERLDAAVLNAGILTSKWSVVNGLESTIAVNVVGSLLLGHLLLPTMRRSAAKTGLRGRLSFVGSDLQAMAQFKEAEKPGALMEILSDESLANMSDRYSVSKLLQLYSVRDLASRSPVTARSNVLITYLTPGACHSDIFRDEAPLVSRMVMGALLALLARTTEQGGRTLVHAVIPELGEELHGKYLMDCRVEPFGENVAGERGTKLAEKWNGELKAKLEGIVPGCTRV